MRSVGISGERMYIVLFFILRAVFCGVRHFVAKCHKTVVEMYVIDGDVFVERGKVIMTEIPEALYAK